MNCPVKRSSSASRTLIDAAACLDRGEITSRALVERCLEAIESSENARAAYTGDVSATHARQAADAVDKSRARGYPTSPWAGLPISIKDLFDLRGEVTRAGSLLLAGRPPAPDDAEAIAHLRAADFVLLGRTQMTEFAYSGLGLNPHVSQPWNTLIAPERAVPGGSSSGGAVSVATGAALATIGSDTGGSCRIPAAFNALTGYKPTRERISRQGMVPLSPSFDSVGAIARTVSDCALLSHIMSGEHTAFQIPKSRKASPIRLLLPTNFVHDNADAPVLAVFEAAINHLKASGIEIVRRNLPLLQDVADLNLQGQIVAAEAYRFFRTALLESPDAFDPRVRDRIAMGEHTSPETLKQLSITRQSLCARFNAEMATFDALICPTTPILPPLITDCTNAAAYGHFNRLILRNPSLANLFDGCSVSLPLWQNSTPSGLMLTACRNHDDTLIAIARHCEKHLDTLFHKIDA